MEAFHKIADLMAGDFFVPDAAMSSGSSPGDVQRSSASQLYGARGFSPLSTARALSTASSAMA
ncbi:hypothetical protein KSP9073_03216 [Kushneria phyllosphaerae]|uniref:Uncharacterized protein n=1 Tax=Kushneria phyllosphaerae TaxID=2100822 RepID=A0A2R8CQJ7_9GAMM|nr:hypothetical protein KSP9073_03216 [Kushneria phyllosphaerae]